MSWLSRLTLGVCGGLLIAVLVLFSASALGVETGQTGGSAGKTLFFTVWFLSASVAMFQHGLWRATAFYLMIGGVLSSVVGLLSAWESGELRVGMRIVDGVNLGFFLTGFCLFVIGWSMSRKVTNKQLECRSTPGN